MRGLLLLLAVSLLSAGDLRLLDAIKRGDQKSVTSLLQQHADVNAAQPDGATALAWAAHLGDAKTVELLLAAGAKVNVADEYGETPLTLACANGDGALVATLLKAGADAKAARWNGESALMLAAGAGSVDAVTQLIANGAEVNAAESRKGQTALMWAAAEGHSAVVKALLDRGANVKTASKSGFTPLVFAAVKNHVEIVKTLLAAGADPNYALPDGNKVLSVAASNRSTAVALTLLDSGAEPSEPLLITGATSGDLDLVEKLLSKGVNPNAKTPNSAGGGRGGGGGGFRVAAGGQSALMLAARGNHTEVMRALLAAGADPKLRAQDGSTFLMAAVGSARVEAVKFAFQYDSDVKAVTTTGATLIHASVTGTANGGTQEAQDRVVEVIRFLAEKGAPLDEKNAQGRTPIDIADVLPIDKAVDLLTELIIKSGLKPKSPSKR